MSAQLLVLDVDDTLYLERDYVRSGFKAVSNYVKEKAGYEDFFDLAWAAFLEGRRRTIFDDILAEVPAATRAKPPVAELVEVYRHHQPAVSLCPDAEEFLNRVHGSYGLGVVTDGPAVSQRRKIQALGLGRWISEFVVTDEHGPEWPKPSILPFRDLQERFDVRPEHCWYLADNPAKDFTGPTKLGWRTIRVQREQGLHFNKPDNNHTTADIHVVDLREAYRYISE